MKKIDKNTLVSDFFLFPDEKSPKNTKNQQNRLKMKNRFHVPQAPEIWLKQATVKFFEGIK